MPSNSAKSRRAALPPDATERRLVIVAFPGVTLLDVSGPAQVFAELADIELPRPGYALSYVSKHGGLVQIGRAHV